MKVTIGIVHGEKVDGWFYHSMTGLQTYLRSQQNILDVEDIILIRSGPLLSAGRGQLAATFLNGTPNSEALVMLDSDMAFTPGRIVELIQTFEKCRETYGENVGALGGLAFISNHNRLHTPMPNIWLPNPEIPEVLHHQSTYPENSLIEVGATGGACIIIHRDVFEAIGRHWFHHIPVLQWNMMARDFARTDDPTEIENILRSSVWDADQLGEDMSFCIRARAHGFRLFLHTGIIFDHCKLTLLGLEEYHKAVETHRQLDEERALSLKESE